jgi:hypothetical protein
MFLKENGFGTRSFIPVGEASSKLLDDGGNSVIGWSDEQPLSCYSASLHRNRSR